MKSIENTEDLIRHSKPKIAPDPQRDRRVLDDSFEAMDESLAGSRSGTSRRWQQSIAMRLAAAAVILITIGLLAKKFDPSAQKPSVTGQIAKSPTDMLSAISLNMAYRRGGIEAVDDLADVAFARPKSKQAKLSIRDLITESNGV